MTAVPEIRLRPKIDVRPIRFGAPWVFADQLVLDRRTKAIPAGTVVDLLDNERQFLARGAFNAHSKIAFRTLASDMATIDQNWIKDKITRALDLRDRIYTAPFYRLVHGEADGLPGLIVDRFGEIAVVQPNAFWIDARRDILTAVLAEYGMTTVVMNGQGRTRKLEGLAQETEMLRGEAPAPVKVPMNNAVYIADIMGGQKTGLFYDQRENHAFLQRFARDARVIDIFSHVGGFALATLAAGARSAVSVDASAPALELAKKGAEAMGAADRFETRQGDAFDVLAGLSEAGESYDIVICDPPAFAPSKQSLGAGLRAYERVARMAAGLVSRGGIMVLCSCSHAATPEKFESASLRGIGKAGRGAQILHRGAAGPDHPVHAALAETGYLKSMFLRLD